MDCPYCSAQLSEISTFCKECGEQVRCKACRNPLEANARFCGECGTALGEKSADGIVSANLANAPRNTIRFEETPKLRSLHADLTDESVANLSDAMIYAFGGMLGSKRPPLKPDSPLLVPRSPLALDNPSNPEDPEILEGEVQSPENAEPEFKRISKIFSFNESGIATLENPELKAKNQRDFVRRLTHLFLYAHHLRGREKVPRAELNAVWKAAKVDDSNARKWLVGAQATIKFEEDLLSLNDPGKREAKSAVNDFFNTQDEKNWKVGTKGNRSGAKKKEENESSPASSSNKPKSTSTSQDVLGWITQWKIIAPDTDVHSIIQSKTLAEKGLLGLWAICKTTNNFESVVSRGKIAQFLNLAFGMKVTDGGPFGKAIEGNGGKVNKVTGGFQLLPAGKVYGEEELGKKTKFVVTKNKPSI